jgi:hypothetical protein
MACDEFRIRIRLFLGGKLDRGDLERFVDHAIHCTACETVLLATPDDQCADVAAGVTGRRGR